MVEVELKQWGNSVGVIIPADHLRELGLHEGDTIDITLTTKRKIDGFGICKGAKPFEEERKDQHREF